MKSPSSSPSGRSSRRGSRRRSSSRFPERTAPAAPPPKPTFWEKVTSFFTGGVPAASGPGVTTTPFTKRPADKNGRLPEGDIRRLPRKPEAVEVTTPRLYVGNLSFDAGESDLSNLFNGVGQVVNVEVISHRHNQRSKGFAFVQMQTVDEAKRAVEQLNDKEFMGRKLWISGAKNADQHDSKGEPRFAA